MATAFPLLRLPLLPILQICKSMDIIEVFAFSLLSKRTNTIAKHLKMTRTININVKENHVELCFPNCRDILINLHLENDQAQINVKLQDRWSSWNNLPISTNKLLNRTLNVFNCELIDDLVMEIPRYDMSPIIATLPNIKEVSSRADITREMIFRPLKALLPKTSIIYLFPRAEYVYPEKLQEILIGNLDFIEIGPFDCYFRLDLDDILITNSTKAVFHCVNLKERDLNRFLKLWKNGTINTRMEHLKFVTDEDFNRDKVLNGLNVIEQPRTTTRTFEFSRNQIDYRNIVSGGHDIRRVNGDLVTVDIDDKPALHIYNIYFWS